jgi:hypothetical protein
MTQHDPQLIVNCGQPAAFVYEVDGGTEKEPRKFSFWKLGRTQLLRIDSRETLAQGS